MKRLLETLFFTANLVVFYFGLRVLVTMAKMGNTLAWATLSVGFITGVGMLIGYVKGR